MNAPDKFASSAALAISARIARAPRSGADSRRAVPGAVGITHDELPDRLAELHAARELVVFCDCPNDESAIAAARLLTKAGLPRVRVLAGGITAWAAAEALAPRPTSLDVDVPDAAIHPA